MSNKTRYLENSMYFCCCSHKWFSSCTWFHSNFLSSFGVMLQHKPTMAFPNPSPKPNLSHFCSCYLFMHGPTLSHRPMGFHTIPFYYNWLLFVASTPRVVYQLNIKHLGWFITILNKHPVVTPHNNFITSGLSVHVNHMFQESRKESQL